MTKREARKALREEIRGLVAAGEPVPSQLIRLARAQGSLKGLTPQFMAYLGGVGGYIPLLAGGSMRLGAEDEVHDMWRSDWDATVRYTGSHRSSGWAAETLSHFRDAAELEYRNRVGCSEMEALRFVQAVDERTTFVRSDREERMRVHCEQGSRRMRELAGQPEPESYAVAP